MSTTCFGYTRVSSKKQDTLKQQERAIRAYAERQGITIIGWFSEKKTASSEGRQEFNKLLKALRLGKADGVIFHKLDRSTRNEQDWARLVALFDRYGTEFHFATEGFDLSNDAARFAANVQAAQASFFSRNLRSEIKKGQNGCLNDGIYPWRAPIGYLDHGRGKLKTICPLNGPLVQRAFEKYATGAHSMTQVAKELKARGLRNSRGTAVDRIALGKVFRNPFYYGLIHINTTGDSFAGAHKLLITKTLYDRVQRVLEGRLPRTNTRYTYPFRGLFRCALCDTAMIGEVQAQKRYTYYRCHTKGCPTKSMREESLHQALEATLGPIVLTDEEHAYLKKKTLSLAGHYQDDDKKARSLLKLRLGQSKARLTKLVDGFLDGHLEDELFTNHKLTLLREQKNIEEELAKPPKSRQISKILAQVLETGKNALLTYKSADRDVRREMLQIVTSKCTVERKKPFIELDLPFQLLADRGGRGECIEQQTTSRNSTTPHGEESTQEMLTSLAEDLVAWATNC